MTDPKPAAAKPEEMRMAEALRDPEMAEVDADYGASNDG
jgi:hypothetical protein